MLAVREGHSPIVEILLKEPGIDVTRRDVNGSTALHLACRYGRVHLLQQLLVHPGGLYCLEWQDKWGETPLLTATRKGHLLCAETLLQVPGIHLATKDGRDQSLVEVARETGNAELVHSLRKTSKARCGDSEEPLLSNLKERRATHSTGSQDNIDWRKQQETLAGVESANQIKQEVEDDDESSKTLALPEDQLSKKRKRSPSRTKSLRVKKSTIGGQEVTEKPIENEEANQTFIDYNHSVRKLLHSEDIPTDIVFKVFELSLGEDSYASERRRRLGVCDVQLLKSFDQNMPNIKERV